MGLFPSLLKTKKPRKFSYTPLYYDERKENLQARIKQIKAEQAAEAVAEANGSLADHRLKEKFKAARFENQHRKSQTGANRRVMIIAVLLSIITWYLLK